MNEPLAQKITLRTKFSHTAYGKRIEQSAGPEVLRRILGGAEISKAEHAGRYYYLALKAKKVIENEFEKIRKEVKKNDEIVENIH